MAKKRRNQMSRFQSAVVENTESSVNVTPDLDTPQPEEIAQASSDANTADLEEATQALSEANPADVLYASHSHEPIKFSIQVAGIKIRSTHDVKGERLVWAVPASLASRFEDHFHFVSGRIIKV